MEMYLLVGPDQPDLVMGDMSKALERAFGISAESWLASEATWRRWRKAKDAALADSERRREEAEREIANIRAQVEAKQQNEPWFADAYGDVLLLLEQLASSVTPPKETPQP